MVKVRSEFPANFHWLVDLCNSSYAGRILIFFWNRHLLGDVFQYVTANTTKGELYMFHKRTDNEQKTLILNKLASPSTGMLQVVLCTSSFSLGLDLADIEFVIHYGPAQTAEDYLQETGRAARKQETQGHAILLNFVGSQAGKHLDDSMRGYLRQGECKRDILNAKFQFTESKKPDNCCDFCFSDIAVPGDILNLISNSTDNPADSVTSSLCSSLGSIASLDFGDESP